VSDRLMSDGSPTDPLSWTMGGGGFWSAAMSPLPPSRANLEWSAQVHRSLQEVHVN
jgi:hypothetical protein